MGGYVMTKRDDARTFLISVAAELAGMHAQTLRTYDRLGLVSPERSSGGGRRYSQHDVDLLREVQRLSQDEGRQPRRHQAHHRADQPSRGRSSHVCVNWPRNSTIPHHAAPRRRDCAQEHGRGRVAAWSRSAGDVKPSRGVLKSR